MSLAAVEVNPEAVLDRLRVDTPLYARSLLKIVPKQRSRGLVSLEPKPGQLALEEKLEEQRLAGKPQRAIVLKARQVGISTWTQAKLIQATTLNPHVNALVVAHDVDTGGKLFTIGQRMYSSLPNDETLKPPIRSHKRARFLHFGQRGEAWMEDAIWPDSTYWVDTAGEFEAGRGGTFHKLHLCLAPSVPILLTNGEIRPVSEAAVGSRVLTHTGAPATISAISASPPTAENGDGRSVILTPWLGQPIELTPNHPVWVKCRRVDSKRVGKWKQAGELTLRDWVGMPVRGITRELTCLTLPRVRYRHNSHMEANGSGDTVDLDEGFGYAVGYYLAEGSLTRNCGKPAGITFSRHRKEQAYADRAIAGLGDLATGRRTCDSSHSLTTTDTVNCSPLARLIEAEFGCKEQKRIPDWVFRAGEDFCRGLLAGYLSGDGSKTDGRQGTYRISAMAASSICSSIATQIRDLAASLGYGWAAIDHKPAGERYGRRCREAWTIRWGGRAARGLRGLVGLDVADNGRPRSEKAVIEDGMVWFKIRKIEEGQVDLVYDVEVDHPDHSFRTLSFSVKNSELAFWPQPLQKLTALNQTVPDDPDTLVVIESTANGMNLFKDLWDDAVDGRSAYTPFFWPWWKEEEYALSLTDAERVEFRVGDTDQSPYAEREPELVDPGPFDTLTHKHVPLSLEQLAWRRWAIANRCAGKIEKFDQEYPTEPEDAFLATGSKVFEPTLVRAAMQSAEQTDPRTGEGGPLVGRIEATERPVAAGRHGKVERPKAPVFKPARELLPGEDADWRVWLASENGRPLIPEEGLYVVGVDVSGGVPESDDPGADPAYHAIQVIDHRTKEQVAEYRSRVDGDLLAEHALLTAELFNDAWLGVEVTGGWGIAPARKLWLDWHYRFLYFRRSHDQREEKQQDRLGWDTNRSTKPTLIAGGQELLREGTHGIRSRRLASELSTYIRLSTGRMVPEKGRFADLLMAWLIAQQIAIEMPLREKPKQAKRAGWRRPRNPITGY